MERFCVAAVILALSACNPAPADGGPTGPPTGPPTGDPVAAADVSMPSGGGNSFEPNNVYVILNGTVTWTNDAGRNHNVTFAATTGAPANIANYSDGSVLRTFATSGTFNYQCTLHSGMTGTVRVQ
jgi:plastocyanin